jgi:N-acetylglucosamine-6-sulfatase
MDNLWDAANAESTSSLAGRPLTQIMDRLDALMLVLKTCKGNVCIEPWKSLHPAENVKNLAQALSVNFDGFYAELPKVKFEFCALGYLAWNEMPNFGPSLVVSNASTLTFIGEG